MGIAELLFASPAAKASANLGGKPITIKYGAPSVRGRQIFGDGGLVSTNWTYPVWRAGANAATTLTTGADLDIGGRYVPAGAYTQHTAEEVAVVADGAGVERVHGLMPNTEIFHIMMSAFGWESWLRLDAHAQMGKDWESGIYGTGNRVKVKRVTDS
jgi:hypothetical protein